MKYRKLGSFEVSAIGLGCMGMGYGYGAAADLTLAPEELEKRKGVVHLSHS